MDKFTMNRTTFAINMEAPVATTAEAGIKAAQAELDQARKHLGDLPSWNAVGRLPMEYLDLLENFARDVQRIKAGRELTPEAKQERARTIARGWLASANDLVERLERNATEFRSRFEDRTRPDPPVNDEGALQAMLANARSDVRMVLDEATENELADRLYELAVGRDPAVSYLVMTDWPATYFRSRDTKSAPLDWKRKRRRALAEILPEDRARDLDRVDAIDHVDRAVHAMRGGHHFMLHDNPDLFERGA